MDKPTLDLLAMCTGLQEKIVALQASVNKAFDLYEARIATLGAELTEARTARDEAQRNGVTTANHWMEQCNEARERRDEAVELWQLWASNANALRDALENAAVTLRKNDLPHHAQVIVKALAQTPAASLAALKAEVRREALAGLLARIKGTVEWRDEFTNYGKAVRYVTQHIESALAAQAATQHYANVKLTAEFDKACAQEVKP